MAEPIVPAPGLGSLVHTLRGTRHNVRLRHSTENQVSYAIIDDGPQTWSYITLLLTLALIGAVLGRRRMIFAVLISSVAVAVTLRALWYLVGFLYVGMNADIRSFMYRHVALIGVAGLVGVLVPIGSAALARRRRLRAALEHE